MKLAIAMAGWRVKDSFALGTHPGIRLSNRVIAFLRFVGIMNGAVWFGAAIFFTFVAAPVPFTPGMLQALTDAKSGIVAIAILQRFFILSYICGAIAVAHQLAEWVYLARTIQRWSFGLLLGILGIGLITGTWLQPKMERLHQIRFGYQRTPAGFYVRDPAPPTMDPETARHAFRTWHGISQGIHLVGLIGLGIYFWQVVKRPEVTRFTRQAKYST